MSDIVPLSNFPDGINVLHDSPDASVDICFVHGLTGDRERTWTADDQSTPWPIALLSLKVHRVRILAFGYDAHSVRKSAVPSNQLIDHAANLLTDLTIDRLSCNASSRPLIFIAHSFGGLVCKKTILLSRNSPEDRLQCLYHALKGVIFMGTPHKGPWMAHWARIPASALGLTTSTNLTLLDVLQTDTRLLESIQVDFIAMVRQLREQGGGPEVTCFFEQLPMPVVGTIVSEKSASLEGYASSGILANHQDMVKFATAKEDGFKRLLGELTRWISEVDRTLLVLQRNKHILNAEDRACLRDLRTTNPRHDKHRIEANKGGLLKDAYSWILDHADFKRWRHQRESNLLWINGGPGKGKTMLLCGIVDELTKSASNTTAISFFFCQATDVGTNHATAVLRGLIFMLVEQQPTLISHIRRHYDKTGTQVFEDVNAWEVLVQILTSILEDSRLQTIYLMIDALDECTTGLDRLLELVAQKSSAYTHAKWIVASRSWPAVEKGLNIVSQKLKLSLELNEESVTEAVAAFIHHKVQILTVQKNYEDDMRDAISHHLLSNAQGSFLWVALVCEELAMSSRRNARQRVTTYPLRLDALYERMIQRILDSEDAEFCKCILGVVLASYRPITLDELSSSVNMPDGFSDDDGFLVEMILACGSFLTMRDRTIFFVHQSAKDFLRHRLNVIFPETTTSAINQARASISPKYTLKDSERDSGYASASRPATLGVSSESAFNDNMESISLRNPREPKFPHDNDIQSLASDSDDINSQASNETTSEAITGKALIRVFLVEEPNFRPLCEKAMTRMGTQRFVENLRRLLKSFHKNLATEAEVEAEKSVARLLRSRRGRLRICQQLVIHIEQEREEARQDERFNLDIAPNAKQHVEKWLTQTFGRELELEELQDQVLNDDSSDSDDNSGRDEFPYISGMENFLRGSRSFQILLKDFMLMFLPAELRHVLLSIPKRHIWVSQEQDLSLPNRLKAWVEDSTQVRWRWWPLKSRKRMLQEGESRMFWRCTCGAQQWEEISVEQQDLVRKILELSDLNPSLPHWCRKKGFGVLLNIWAKGFFSKAPSSLPGTTVSSAAQKYIPPGNAASLDSSGNHPSGHDQSSVTGPTQPHQSSPSTGQRLRVSTMDPSERTKSWILLGVQGARRTLTPAQISVKDQSTDCSVFQDLKECYRTQRGRLRLWFSIWRLEFCQVVKFNRLTLDRMVREHRDLPTHMDYQYAPRAGAPDARNPPISPHLFEALLYTCRSPCTWPLPHDCMPPPTGVVHLDRIPKRSRCFERETSSPIWGLEAVFAASFAYVLIYHFVIVAGPFAFFAWWLKFHPDDLQNASIPLSIVLGALSLFWSGAGILTSKSKD